jgi:hypothetical protein
VHFFTQICCCCMILIFVLGSDFQVRRFYQSLIFTLDLLLRVIAILADLPDDTPYSIWFMYSIFWECCFVLTLTHITNVRFSSVLIREGLNCYFVRTRKVYADFLTKIITFEPFIYGVLDLVDVLLPFLSTQFSPRPCVALCVAAFCTWVQFSFYSLGTWSRPSSLTTY